MINMILKRERRNGWVCREQLLGLTSKFFQHPAHMEKYRNTNELSLKTKNFIR